MHAAVILAAAAGLVLHSGVFLAAVAVDTAVAVDDTNSVVGECELRHGPPAQNVQPLVFCNWYHHKSCCLPAHDNEISGLFQSLIDAGESCAKFQNRAKYYLSVASCYGCDPDEPMHFTTPTDTAFFDATKSVKICASVARGMVPSLFADCGLLLSDDRDSSCSPSSAVVPHYVWPDCLDKQYVCQNNATFDWSCSDAPCGDGNTPQGFADAPCNEHAFTCSGVIKFLNDNRAAKPVNYEDYPVEIIDVATCGSQYGHNAAACRCLQVPSSTAAAAATTIALTTASGATSDGNTPVATVLSLVPLALPALLLALALLVRRQ